VRGRHQEVTHLLGIVRDGEQVEVVRADVALAEHVVADPVDHLAPVVGAHEDDRELDDLPGLDQRERLEELVHRAEPAREHDEAAGVANEHDLAGEEVVELECDVAVGVGALFEGQLDVEPNRMGARILRPAVGGLHESRATARDDRHAVLADGAGGLARELVVGVVRLRARRAEEAGGRADVGECLETPPKLVADALDPVLVGECRPDRRLLGGDDLLVQGAGIARRGIARHGDRD